MGFRVPTSQLYMPSASITHQSNCGWHPLRISSYSNPPKNAEKLEAKKSLGNHLLHHLYYFIPSWKYLCKKTRQQKQAETFVRHRVTIGQRHFTLAFHQNITWVLTQSSELQITEAAGVVWLNLVRMRVLYIYS